MECKNLPIDVNADERKKATCIFLLSANGGKYPLFLIY